MSKAFREFLQKVGSGTHTGQNLTREEATTATRMMLEAEATPAQIGAFLIAHRIKRPTPEELAGMLDAYKALGPQLTPLASPTVVFGTPYDGRSRTMPVMPITALLLASSGLGVVLHGGDCMPTKYGLPWIEIFRGLGVDFSALSLAQTQQLLQKAGLALIYLPQHFPLAQPLVTYREEIGKRPPLATLELIWSPIQNAHIVAGFVHPPTEERFQETFRLLNFQDYTLVKGLEGSCDLACSRTGIIALGSVEGLQRFHLHPRDYDLAGKDIPLESPVALFEQLQAVLHGKNCELMPAAILNGGFYLWRFGLCQDLEAGFAQAEEMLVKGTVLQKLEELKSIVSTASSSLNTVQ